MLANKMSIFIIVLLAAFLHIYAKSQNPLAKNDEYNFATTRHYTTEPEAYNKWKSDFMDSLRQARLAERGALARTTEAMLLSSGNGWVDVVVDNGTTFPFPFGASAEFDQGCDPSGGGSYVKLTYSYAGPPGTEWVIYYVDGYEGKTDESLPDADTVYRSGSTIYAIWRNWRGVYIRQELTPVRLGASPGDLEQIRFRAVMKTADGSCHNCGCIVYYDTMLDSNDGSPIATAYGYVGVSEIFYAPDIPPLWHAYEFTYPPAAGDIVATGILTGFEAVEPDVFWYGPWPSSYTLGWNDAPWVALVGSGFSSDTATRVKWLPRTVCSNDSVVFVTYYGIGEISGTSITLNHAAPTIRPICFGVRPDPFTITALITNAGTVVANNVTATLNLSGSSLTLVGGDPTPITYPTIYGYGGTQIVNWQVDIPPSAYGTTQCYTINVTWDGGSPITRNYCISVPIPLSPPTPSLSADDSTLCPGMCTFLHATPGTGPGPSCGGFSTTFEPTNGGFVASGNTGIFGTGPTDWNYGSPTSGPGGARSSPNCWATRIAGNYSNYSNSRLTSPTIDLTGCGSATLTFWHWYNMQTGALIANDGGNLKISIDGGSTWTLMTPSGGYPIPMASVLTYGIGGEACYSGSSGGWVMATFDLTPYVGHNVQIRWHFGSDGSTVMAGWYIDDVTVTGVVGGESPWRYIWSPITGLSDSNSLNPEACPPTTTTYTFTVTDGGDCTGSASVIINVSGAEVLTWIECPFPCMQIAACNAQTMIFGLRDTTGCGIDTVRTYFTAIVRHADGTRDTTRLSGISPSVDFSVFTADSMFAIIRGTWANGDSVRITLDSLYNRCGCKTVP